MHRRYDKLTGRLRAAEFTFNTLLARTSELRKILSNGLASASDSALKDHTPPSYKPPAPEPASRSNPNPNLHNPSDPLPTHNTDPSTAPFLHNSSPPNHSESSSSSTDWTHRCTTYYAKRKLQEEATKARRASHGNASSRQSSFQGSKPHPRSQSYSSQPPPQTPNSQPQPHERAQTRDQMRKAAVVAPAWNAYTRGWDLITTTLGSGASGLNTPSSPSPDVPPPPPFLSMTSIPWPILRVPLDGEVDPCELTPEDIREFLLSPYHSPNKPKEARIREAYLRWHPDKANKWMASVISCDRVRVKQAVDRVAWCLNQLK